MQSARSRREYLLSLRLVLRFLSTSTLQELIAVFRSRAVLEAWQFQGLRIRYALYREYQVRGLALPLDTPLGIPHFSLPLGFHPDPPLHSTLSLSLAYFLLKHTDQGESILPLGVPQGSPLSISLSSFLHNNID